MNDGWKFAPLEATDQMAGGGMRASNVWWIRDSRTKERAGIFLSFFFLQSIRVPRTERRRSCQLQNFPVQFDSSGMKEEGTKEETGKKIRGGNFHGVHRRI